MRQNARATIFLLIGIGKNIAEAGKNMDKTAKTKYPHYIFAFKGYIYEGLLTDAKCKEYNLSCDRW